MSDLICPYCHRQITDGKLVESKLFDEFKSTDEHKNYQRKVLWFSIAYFLVGLILCFKFLANLNDDPDQATFWVSLLIAWVGSASVLAVFGAFRENQLFRRFKTLRPPGNS